MAQRQNGFCICNASDDALMEGLNWFWPDWVLRQTSVNVSLDLSDTKSVRFE